MIVEQYIYVHKYLQVKLKIDCKSWGPFELLLHTLH